MDGISVGNKGDRRSRTQAQVRSFTGCGIMALRDTAQRPCLYEVSVNTLFDKGSSSNIFDQFYHFVPIIPR